MSKPVQLDKPWFGHITWEPISNLPTLVRTVDNAINDAERQGAVLDQSVEKAHLFKDFPIATMIEGLTDQRHIVAVYRRQIEQWRNGPLSAEQHFDLAFFEGQCVRLDSLLSFALGKAGEFSKKVKPGRPTPTRR